MNCYDQQYPGGKEKEPLSSRSIRSQLGNSAARDWRNANVMPMSGRGSVSSQEYQKEPMAECQNLYEQYSEWGWNCPNPGCSPSWQNVGTTGAVKNPTAKPGNPVTAEPGPGPVLRPEPGNTPEEKPPVSGCPVDFSNYPIGMAYVPMQRWGKIYDLDAGFSRGTIFPDLDLPFLAGRCI